MFNREKLKEPVSNLAVSGVFIGTSSWKYPGWCGQLYDENRYFSRLKKFSKATFEEKCLSEYAEVFKTVCFDGAHYRFYEKEYWEKLSSQVPPDFQFALKVPDAITIKKYTNLPRFGVMAGKMNPDFLNSDKFVEKLLKPCESIRSQIGILMFEFSHFYPSLYEHERYFVSDLDAFFNRLPTGWPYGVELRNKYWLNPEYFECLARHNVTHVFNSWTDVPPIGEQMALPGSETNPTLIAARFLLKSGHKYDDAVDLFHPYDKTKEVNEEARLAGASLIKRGMQHRERRKTFIYVNNRLEGNALSTIEAMLALVNAEG